MIAAKIYVRDGRWTAWLGISLEHIRHDAERMGYLFLGTLRPISLAEVQRLRDYLAGLTAMMTLEFLYRGRRIPYQPGQSAFSLGNLPPAA